MLIYEHIMVTLAAMAALWKNQKNLKILQPPVFPNRSIGEGTKYTRKGAVVIMDMLRQLIRSAIESFPIDPSRKERLLQKLLNSKNRGVKK